MICSSDWGRGRRGISGSMILKGLRNHFGGSGNLGAGQHHHRHGRVLHAMCWRSTHSVEVRSLLIT